MEFLALLALCCLLPILLITGLIGFWIGKSLSGSSPKPADQFANLVYFWLETNRLDTDTAERVLRLLEQEGATLRAKAQPAPPASPSPETSETVTSVSPLPEVLQASSATVAAALPIHPAPAPTAPPSTVTDRIGPIFAALLSLGTRRMLLVIGTFLLIISSLVLVIFNWNSFLPIVQVGILAALTGGLWGLGWWMGQREALATAGRNLSSIAALFVPIVVFSFTRPGLLNLATDTALLVVSGVSMAIYIGGAWYVRRVFYSLAASAAAIGVLVSAFWQWDVGLQWQPVWAFGWWFAALVVTHRLVHSSAAPLALGPRVMQWAGPPLSLLVSLSLVLAEPTPMLAWPAMIAFGLGGVFGAGAAWLERQPRWVWVTALTLPVAVLIGTVLPDLGLRWANLNLALLTSVYVGMMALIERRGQAYAIPLLASTPLLLVVALLTALDRTAIGQSYPLLLVAGGLLVVLLERGQLRLLQPNRTLVGSIGLALVMALLNVWVASFVEAWVQRGLITLVIGGIGFVLHAASVTARISYAPLVLRWTGAALIAIGSLMTALLDPVWRLPALALAAMLYGWCAFRERNSFWSVASLTVVLGLVASVLERVGWLSTFEHYLLAGTSVASVYAIGGSLIRRGPFGYWATPALFWGGVLGSGSTLLLISAFFTPSMAAVSAALIASIVWLGLSFIWQRWQFGYPAAAMLGWAWLLAVVGEFLRWEGGLSGIGVLAVLLGVGYGGAALVLRRWAPFDRPYAQLAIATALVLPIPTLPVVLEVSAYRMHLPLTAVSATLILAVGAVAYRRWRILSLALIQLVMAIGGTANWLFAPNVSLIGWTLLTTAVIVGLGGTGVRRRGWAAVLRVPGLDSYGIGAVTGLIALMMLFNGSLSSIAWPLLICALTIGIIAVSEQSEVGAVLNVTALIGSIAGWLAQTDLTIPWQAAWLVLALVPLMLAGWAIRRYAPVTIWQRPTLWLPLMVGGFTVIVAAYDLRALVIALINTGVLYVTATVRERRSEYAYIAGATFVAASLGQFLIWDLREMQLYVIPVGVYLLALANGIRYFQRQDRLARVVDTGAVGLLLGATFLQAAGSPSNVGYILFVGGESLLIATYGALMRLRVPFVGGLACFVLGILWLVGNAARMLNQWLLLGLLGLLMLLAYVVLERQQERLRRAGRDWATRLQRWR